jgi:hypothetical protein
MYIGIGAKTMRQVKLMTAALFLISPFAANADPILDQFSFVSVPTTGGVDFVSGSTYTAPPTDVYLGQTFSVGSTGTLEQINLVVSNQWATLDFSNPDFFFDIRPVSSGVPVEDNSLALVSRTLTLTTSGQSLIEISGIGLSVSVGDGLAIVLHAGEDGAFQWHGGEYAAGSAYARNISDPANFNYLWTGPRHQAFAFQTYIECESVEVECNPNVFPPSPPESVSVPEPGTLALFGIGLFGMGLARRRKTV